MEVTRCSKVLIVDDEADTLESLAALIDHLLPGVQAVAAASPLEGLEILKAGDIDAVVSDHRLPGTDGPSFLRDARHIAPATPRMLMTAYPDLEVVLRSLHEGGIRAFLAKPLDPEVFLRTIAELVELSKASRLHPNLLAT